MTSFAIGDVQGCFDSFQALLAKLEFDSKRDHLVFVGDLVNRGTHSLEVAQWILEQGSAVSAVLGNHDVHFLALVEGATTSNKFDTVDALLASSIALDFRDWLLAQCFFMKRNDWQVAHAGIFPEWTFAKAQNQSDSLMETLRGANRAEFLKSYREPFPLRLQDIQSEDEHHRFALSAFTRMRCFELDGSLNFGFNGELDQLPESLEPWFRLRENSADTPIVFGHWAALGNHTENHCYGIDSGCLWGRGLTALNLDTKERITVATVPSDLR